MESQLVDVCRLFVSGLAILGVLADDEEKRED
jgi:hypothetical protein